MSSKKTPSRVRTAWFPLLASVGDGPVQLDIGWKYVDGSIGLFSADPKNKTNRRAWGRIIGCKMKQVVQSGESQECYIFENKGRERKGFKYDELNPTLWKMCDFSAKLLELRSEQKKNLISLYLHLMVHSNKFSEHRDGVHDSLGFAENGSGVTVDEIIQNDGSLEEYQEFLAKALGDQVKVESENDIIRSAEGSRKGKAGEPNQTQTNTLDMMVKVKRSRKEQIEDLKTAEIEDSNGVEKSYIGKFIGREDINIDQLTVSESVKIPMKTFKVYGLAEKILQRPDPSLLILTVCPASGQSFDEQNLKRNKYDVIHGRHRVEALKRLHQKGQLVNVPGCEDREISCIIVKTQCALEVNYAALRGNDVQSDYVRKPFIHELVFVLDGLKGTYSNNKIEEMIMRYSTLLEFGHDERTALKKICLWPQSSLSNLSKILKLFETFQTSDADYLAKRQSSKILKGSTVAVPFNLFKRIGKMAPGYIESISEEVFSKKLSLRDAVDRYEVMKNRNNVLDLISSELPGRLSKDQLLSTFPSKLSDDILDSFSGAVVEGKSLNLKGKALKEYCKGLISTDETVIKKDSFTEITEIKAFDFSTLPDFQTLVVQFHSLSDDQIDQLKMLRVSCTSLNFVFITDSHESYVTLLKQLDDDFHGLWHIYFDNPKPKLRGDFLENHINGVCSVPLVLRPPVKSYNGPLNNLSGLVNQITLTGGDNRVIFLNLVNTDFVSIQSSNSVQYMGNKFALKRLSQFLSSAKDVESAGATSSPTLDLLEESVIANARVEDMDSAIVGDSENCVSNEKSSTPNKNNTTKFHDSGLIEDLSFIE